MDKENEQEIINILSDLAHKENKCVIIVSHSPEVKKNVDEVIYLTNGKIKDILYCSFFYFNYFFLHLL